MNMNNNNFNTQSLLSEINTIINNGVQDIVKDYMKRHELLEETHNVLVNLPSVKEYYYSVNTINACNTTKPADNKVSVKIEKDIYITKTELMEYMKNMDDKMSALLKQMSELKTEIDILKNNTDKDVISIYECVDVEKENIKLEILDIKQENTLEHAVNECKIEETQDEEEEVEEVEEADEEEVEEVEEADEEEVEEVEEVEETASVETETKKEDSVDAEEEEEEEELIEIEIDDVTYCTNNEDNGIIYEVDKEGNVGKKVGYLKDGEAYFDE